jgi:hypothetical protein
MIQHAVGGFLAALGVFQGGGQAAAHIASE